MYVYIFPSNSVYKMYLTFVDILLSMLAKNQGFKLPQLFTTQTF